jgi:hypothetical protein
MRKLPCREFLKASAANPPIKSREGDDTSIYIFRVKPGGICTDYFWALRIAKSRRRVDAPAPIM